MHKSKTLHELKEHIPFTLIATIIAIILVFLFQKILSFTIPEEFFHYSHFLHIFASSIVTAGIFYKYKKNIWSSILIGIFGSILIGTISDVFFPFLGGNFLNLNTTFHLPLIEKPIQVLTFSLAGCLVGIKFQKTKFPHLIHVFLSVFASLFYITSFSNSLNTLNFIFSIIIVFIAVIIPCCVSDILIPTVSRRKPKT